MIPPEMLCDQHLLGEHGEIHKHRHNFEKQHQIAGRMMPVVQIEPKSMQSRHDDLAQEMLRRDMNHKSPYTQPDISYLPEGFLSAEVDTDQSLKDLCHRCDDCRQRIEEKVGQIVPTIDKSDLFGIIGKLGSKRKCDGSGFDLGYMKALDDIMDEVETQCKKT